MTLLPSYLTVKKPESTLPKICEASTPVEISSSLKVATETASEWVKPVTPVKSVMLFPFSRHIIPEFFQLERSLHAKPRKVEDADVRLDVLFK